MQRSRDLILTQELCETDATLTPHFTIEVTETAKVTPLAKYLKSDFNSDLPGSRPITLSTVSSDCHKEAYQWALLTEADLDNMASL